MKKHSWKIILGVVVILLAGSFVISQQAAEQANEGVSIEPHIKGNPDATVTLTEYADFQCPACGQFYPIVKTLMEDYGDQIRYEYRHFPLITIHPYAAPAARAAEAAAQQGKFWEFHDKLFEEQTAWSNSANANAVFVSYADELGLDTGTFKRHMGSSIIEEAVTASFREAQDKGFTSTPTFELNGVRMSFETYADFIGQIEAAIGVGSSTPETADVEASDPAAGVRFGI